MPPQNATAVRIVNALTVRQTRVIATARTVKTEMAASAGKIANAEIAARENATAKQGTKAVIVRVTARAVSAARTASANIAKQARENATARPTARVAAIVVKTANVSTAPQALW